jgi:hypothetical protein
MEWLAVIVGTVAVLIIAFLRGATTGSDEQELEQTKEVLDNVAKSKVPDGGNINDVRQRLRDNAPRK